MTAIIYIKFSPRFHKLTTKTVQQDVIIIYATLQEWSFIKIIIW